MSGSATPNHLPPKTPDLTGQPERHPVLSVDADRTADVLIREVMVEQKRHDNHAVLPELEKPTAKARVADEKTARVKHPRRLFKKAPVEASVADDASSPGSLAKGLNTAFGMIRGYRPSRKHLFFAAIAVIIYVRPWLIPITLFVAFWVVLIGYLTLGPDRVAELVVNLWQRLHARRPELAETIRQRADKMASRIDTALDRVPGSWTDSLHVPDFSEPERAVADRPDPFDRLAKEAQRG